MDNGMDSSASSVAGDEKPLNLFKKLDYINKEDKEKPHCAICNLQLSADGVKDHIASKRHIAAFHSRGCDGIKKRKPKGHRCLYCKLKLRGPKSVYHHVTTEMHLRMVSVKNSSKGKQNNVPKIPNNVKKNDEVTPCIGISKLNDLMYMCHLCNRDSGLLLNLNDIESHIAGKRHRSFLPEASCIEGKIKDTEDLKISNNLLKSSIVIENSLMRQENSLMRRENSLIRRENSVKSIDSKNSNSSKIFGAEKIGVNSEFNVNDIETEFHRRLFTSFFDKHVTYFYTCFICVGKNDMDYSVFGKNKDKLLSAHIRGEQHGATMMKFGCDNIVGNGIKYYCQTCSIKMFGRKQVYEHIQSEDHLRLTKIIRNDRMSFGVLPEDLFIYAIKQNSTWIADTYYCWICGEDDFYLPQKNLKGHLKSELHKNSLKKFGCKEISRKSDSCNYYYYCSCCKIEFADMKKVFFHVKEKDHINRCEKKDEQPKTSELEIKVNSKIEDNDFETELHCHLFTSFFDNSKPYCHDCFICVTEFETNYSVYGKNKDKLLQAHIRGELHGATVAKLGCDKIVDRGKKYYCETCNTEMTGRKQVLTHIRNENHLQLIKMLLNDRMNFDVASEDFFIYAIKQNSNFITDTFYCWICDEDSSHIPQKRLKAHVTSKLHKDSLKKYACQYITRRYDRYYCNCCEIEFDNMKNVFFHVKEENHIKQKSIVLLQEDKNMISNFTLEEKSEHPNILSDLQSELNELETEENTKILIDDRDLSLHYISSDPEILRKGNIPKSLQKFAKKIKKQKEDNPYCLICNFEIPGYPAIDDHIKGKLHSESFLRNGCDKILQKNPKNKIKFSCELCLSNIRAIENLYHHIRSNGHLLKVRKARPELFESQQNKAKKKIQENLPLASQTFTDLYKLQSSNFDSQTIVNEENNEKSLNFNSILSSISDDLSRMLSHMEIGSQAEGSKKKIRVRTKNQNWDRTKNGKKKKKKKRFAETSPDRDGGFVCSVCQSIFPRKAELHQHMAIHFGQEFGHVISDEDDSTDEENSEIEEENSEIEEENLKIKEKISKIEEEKAKDSEESFPELIFR